MSAFLDTAKLEQIGWEHGRPLWLTLAPLRYRSETLGRTLVVPAEFITDLASVPRWALVWWVAGGRGMRSSILHDFPYQFGYFLDAAGARIVIERATVDAEFYASLLADPMSGAGVVIAQMMYRAVRLGGRGHWDNDERTISLNPEWAAAGWTTATAP